jgi:DNA-binding LytR/AlgR family response regulator
MKFYIEEIKNNELDDNEYKIIIEYNNNSKNNKHFIQYIKNYCSNDTSLFLNNNEIYEEILIKDILYFYSEGRYNYAKTKNKVFKIKAKLYEMESDTFLRISKHCIVNIEHVLNFDLSKTGQFLVNIDNGDKEVVSRRCIKNVLYFLDEKGV